MIFMWPLHVPAKTKKSKPAFNNGKCQVPLNAIMDGLIATQKGDILRTNSEKRVKGKTVIVNSKYLRCIVLCCLLDVYMNHACCSKIALKRIKKNCKVLLFTYKHGDESHEGTFNSISLQKNNVTGYFKMNCIWDMLDLYWLFCLLYVFWEYALNFHAKIYSCLKKNWYHHRNSQGYVCG